MAQINLLKQNTPSQNFNQGLPKILVRVFAVVLILVACYYAYLLIDLGSVNKQIQSTASQASNDIAAAFSVQGRDELLTRQLQLKDLGAIIPAHPYWSQLFPELARVTLKTASYNTMQVGLNNQLSLSAVVPTLQDLDKYMQVFNLPQFNQNFYNLRISSFNKVSDKASTAINFQLRMDYNPSLINYNPGN